MSCFSFSGISRSSLTPRRAVNALFLLDAKGKVLLSRNYRGYVTNAVVSRFVAQLLEEEEVNLKVTPAPLLR